MLTGEAIRAIAAATEIYGSRRAIELARDHIPAGARVQELSDYRHLRDLPDHAVILSTGDPMLAGLGMIGNEVIPGISSLQIVAARLHIPLSRFAIVSAHGKDHAEAIAAARDELGRGKYVFLLSDPAFDIREFAGAIGEGYRIALCEELGYPGERIVTGTSSAPPETTSGLFVVIAWKDA